MIKKTLKYTLPAVIIALIGMNSVYFKKLDEVKAASKAFNAVDYSQKFWDEKLLPSLSKAIDINRLTYMLKENPEKTFTENSHALGIGNIRFFLVKGSGMIGLVNDNDIILLTGKDTSQLTVRLATEYVFGNAVRDATGLININEFTNTMNFNNISAELNKIVRTKVLPPFKAAAAKGDSVQFSGAVEFNKEHLNLNDIEIVPIDLKITKGK